MPDQITRLLDQIDRLDQQATKGPWQNDGDEILGAPYKECGYLKAPHVGETYGTERDAEFIALARTALPQLAKALRAVMELHKPFDWSFSAGDQAYTITSCKECARLGADEEDAIYPCPTVQAITDAMEDQ